MARTSPSASVRPRHCLILENTRTPFGSGGTYLTWYLCMLSSFRLRRNISNYVTQHNTDYCKVHNKFVEYRKSAQGAMTNPTYRMSADNVISPDSCCSTGTS